MTSWLAFLTHDLLSFLMVVVLVSLLLLETGCQVEVKANFKYHCVVEDDSELLQPPRPPGFQSTGCFTTHEFTQRRGLNPRSILSFPQLLQVKF